MAKWKKILHSKWRKEKEKLAEKEKLKYLECETRNNSNYMRRVKSRRSLK